MQQRCAKILLENLDIVYKGHKQVAVKLESYWGSELCHRYLKYLLVKECVENDDERQDRTGFKYDVYVTILALYVMHVKLYTDFGTPVTLKHPNIAECDMTEGPTVEEAVAECKATECCATDSQIVRLA